MKINKGMVKQSFKHFKVSKTAWILFFSITLSCFNKVFAMADTTQKPLLAAVNTNDKACEITLDANVIYPEALAGNEEQTAAYIEKFAKNRRAYLLRTYKRSQKYFPKVVSILDKHNLPQELRVLLALESAFNANAVSKAGAVGYWQIMDDVAKEYGLRIATKSKETKVKGKGTKNTKAKKTIVKSKPQRDDRKNFYKSTYAAARYLKDRSRNLDNDLLLMVASYNCGVGNVWEAMKKTGKDDPSFWDVKQYLPSETQAYVMNFITLNVIFNNYEKFENNTLLFTPVTFNPGNVKEVLTEAPELTTSNQ